MGTQTLTDMPMPQWLKWARRLQAVAQAGFTYCNDPFDLERYSEIRHIAAEMMNAGAGFLDGDHFLDLFTREAGYPTPKIDVRAAAFCDDQLLLVREREEQCWTLPGGWADIGESPSAAAVREAKEESGYDVVVRKLAAVYDRDRHGHPPIPFHAYKIFFLCDLSGGEPQVSHEIDAVDFFPEDKLPPLSLTRVTAVEISHMFDHLRHPEYQTSFD